MNKFLVSRWLVWFVVLGGPASFAFAADEPPVWQLRSSAESDRSGVYLDEVFASAPVALPHLLLLALRAGARQSPTFSREQITDILREHVSDVSFTNWTGPKKILIVRRTQPLDEPEIKRLLTEALQQDVVKDRGELELRFPRPWTTLAVPADPLTLKIMDLPASGFSPSFIVRFELSDGRETVGQWQIPVQAKIWQEVWVATASIPRGQPLNQAALGRERRDVLAMRDPVPSLETNAGDYEMAETLRTGMPLTSRSFRLRPVIRRGKLAEAVVEDGSLSISVKVEALEDGVPGQTIRVRNLKSKREFRGKVENEETILVTL